LLALIRGAKYEKVRVLSQRPQAVRIGREETTAFQARTLDDVSRNDDYNRKRLRFGEKVNSRLPQIWERRERNCGNFLVSGL
jgi:hypothetical protein